MDSAQTLLHKQRVHDFLSEYCFIPRAFSEIVSAISHESDIGNSDQETFEATIREITACINTNVLVRDRYSPMKFRFNKSLLGGSSSSFFGAGSSDLSLDDDGAAPKALTLQEFRDFLRFLSLFYDIASRSYSFPVSNWSQLMQATEKRQQPSISVRRKSSNSTSNTDDSLDHSFSLLSSLALNLNNQGVGSVGQSTSAMIKFHDADFARINMSKIAAGANIFALVGSGSGTSASISSNQGQVVLGWPLLVTKKDGKHHLVPLFYFVLNDPKFASENLLSSQDAIGPFYNESFTGDMVDVLVDHGKLKKRQAKKVIETFKTVVFDRLSQKDQGLDALMDIRYVILEFFGKYCYGHMVAGSARDHQSNTRDAYHEDFTSLHEISSLSHHIVQSAVVSVAKSVPFKKKIAQEFKQLLNASDTELMKSALSCFFYDQRTAEVRDTKAQDEEEASHVAPAFNSFAIDSQAAQVFDFDESMPCDDDQVQAVRSMLKNDLTVLQGPPGTGKTMTVVNAVYNHLVRGQKVLVTSYNGAAIDAFYHKAALPVGDNIYHLAKFLKDKKNSSALPLKALAKELCCRTQFLKPAAQKSFSSFGNRVSDKERRIAELENLRDNYEHSFNEQQAILDDLAYRFASSYGGWGTSEKVPRFVDKLFHDFFSLKHDQSSSGSALSKDELLSSRTYEVRFAADTQKELEYIEYLRNLSQNVIGLKAYKEQKPADAYEQISWLLRWWYTSSLERIFSYINSDQLLNLIEQVIKVSLLKADLCAQKKKLGLSHPEIPTIDCDEVNAVIAAERAAVPNDVTALITKISDRVTDAEADADYSADDDEFADTDADLNDWDADYVFNSDTGSASYVTKQMVSELRGLLAQPDAEEKLAVKARRLLEFFPITTTTLLSVPSSLPLESALVDLVVFDEAAQFNFIDAIPIMFRAKRVAVIGDPKQLAQVGSYARAAVTTIANAVNLADDIRIRYDINYSLYDFAYYGCAYNYALPQLGSATNASNTQEVECRLQELMLRQNRRSVADIVNYISRSFYSKNLIASRKEIDSLEWKKRGFWLDDYPMGLNFINIENDAIESDQNGSRFSKAEVAEAVRLLRYIFLGQAYEGTVGVIAPYRSQCSHLQEAVFGDKSLSAIYASGEKLQIDTVHRFQGKDCDTIIYCLCLGSSGSRDFALDEHIVNVALSRARDYLFVIGDSFAVSNHRDKAHMYYLRPYIRRSMQQKSSKGEGRSEQSQTGKALRIAYANINYMQQQQLYRGGRRFDTQWEKALYEAIRHELDNDEFFAGEEHQIFVQLPMLTYRLDMALVYGKLGLDIECDGSQHYEYWIDATRYRLVESDISRQERLKAMRPISFDTVRFHNSEITFDASKCAKKVIELYKDLISEVRGESHDE